MLRTMAGACAALMALTMPFATTAATAMPLTAPAWTPPAVVQVQHDARNWEREMRRAQRGDRWGGDRWDRRDGRWDRRAERRGDVYWRGHRGHREYRPGYRRHGDFWFPPAAFIAGAIIGGAIASQPPPRQYYRGDPHLEWCYARYRSYRSSDNTFQPYHGPRRQCHSPYG